MYEYTSIYCSSHSGFNKELKRLTNEGWIPEGNPTICVEHNSNNQRHVAPNEKFFLLLKKKIGKES